MIAALPMYDLPWLRPATDRLWQAVRAHLPEAPESLTREADLWEVWQSPDLVLAQTCGLPYRARLHDRVTLVASPRHDLPGDPPGFYHSVLIRRRGDGRSLADLARGVLAVNDPLSQSGWAAPRALLAAQGLAPARVRVTGAHLASVEAVLDGQADVAAIDAVTLSLLERGAPATWRDLDRFARTAPTPALPYITAAWRDPAPVARALDAGIAGLTQDDRDALCLQGVVRVPAAAYRALPIPAAPPG